MTDVPEKKPTESSATLTEIASAVQVVQEFGEIIKRVTFMDYATYFVDCSFLDDNERMQKVAQEKEKLKILLNQDACQSIVDDWTRGWSEKNLHYFNEFAEKSGRPQMLNDEYQEMVRNWKDNLLRLFLEAETVYKYHYYDHHYFYLLNHSSVTVYFSIVTFMHVD